MLICGLGPPPFGDRTPTQGASVRVLPVSTPSIAIGITASHSSRDRSPHSLQKDSRDSLSPPPSLEHFVFVCEHVYVLLCGCECLWILPVICLLSLLLIF